MPLPPPAQPLPSFELHTRGPAVLHLWLSNVALKGRLLSCFPLEADVVHCLFFSFFSLAEHSLVRHRTILGILRSPFSSVTQEQAG